MIPLSTAEIRKFQNKILTWYGEHQRDLPWRRTRNPYHILVSEIMLQQTQVNRVIPKYEAWLMQLPTINDLAQASTADVLLLWSGLGYNRRAINLKKTAQIVTTTYNGHFPQTEKELLALPGIGTYTARALLCFAFDKQVAVVDINVKKVILTQILNNNSEHFGHSERSEESQGNLSERSQALRLGDSSPSAQNDKIADKKLAEIADALLPHGKAYEWNQALMDYSSTVLKKEKIFVPKQSKFIGSHRYYRGQILKLLLQRNKIAINDLGKLIKTDYTDKDEIWLQALLKELKQEGFIVVAKKQVHLAS